MKNIVFTVHELNNYVRAILNRDPILRQVRVTGEISNYKHHSSGHMYFTLKDDKDRINCVFFRQSQKGLDFIPQDGDGVEVTGYVSIYGRDGQYQLYVESMEKAGVGQLYKAFEALKRKLEAKGVFDKEFKKPLPPYPKKIAVITSHTGAAVRDIINVITRRNKHVDILVVPAAVQGKEAPCQICDALDYVNTRDDIDIIILGRGGGSIEELWAFNEEEVALAIWRSRIPIISAVGHETDFTIADFVSDVRAPTPSAAGEIAVPEFKQMRTDLLLLHRDLQRTVKRYIDYKRKDLEGLMNSYVFKSPQVLVNNHIQNLDQLNQRLGLSTKSLVQAKRNEFTKTVATINALNPLNILERGYTYTLLKETDKHISSVSHVKPNDKVKLIFKDGQADCTVDEIHKSSKNQLDEDI